ncbi:MAG: DUF4974 domain-containing protein, partial [Planctomycetes bacterium]|nr:DUF4974 domain-containing protein [Planctomycetota bacterium]
VANSNEPITVDFVPRDPYRQGFNPVLGLEQMPFGASMFGPWRVGEAGTTVIRPSVEHGGVSQVIESSGGLSFENTSLRVVMQYIAASAGLKVRYEEEIGQRKISCILPKGPFTRNEAITLIDSICKSNALDFIRDGDVFILRKRPKAELARVAPASIAGQFEVSFEDCPWVDAVMETAVIARAQVFVPAREPNGEEWGPVVVKKISLKVENATADHIFREIARLAELDVEVREYGDGNAYFFTYRE